MAQFEPYQDEIKQVGAQLVYIAAEKGEGCLNRPNIWRRIRFRFLFCWMKTASVTKAYGLYHRIGHDAINIAHPASLVVDQGGMVRYIYRGDNQTDRAPVEGVLERSQEIDRFQVERSASILKEAQ